ncbi:hypothetical protein J6590_019624 [Homalodisca vitripennis]|nr:hypothetical protein J6590_019624 [Homalodisca vitripennis]
MRTGRREWHGVGRGGAHRDSKQQTVERMCEGDDYTRRPAQTLTVTSCLTTIANDILAKGSRPKLELTRRAPIGVGFAPVLRLDGTTRYEPTIPEL